MALATLLAGVVYLGGRRLPMRLFFSETGVVLIVFAAGLLARSVQLLQAGHDLGSVNRNGVYDLRDVSWLTTRTEVGRFLAALFGFDVRGELGIDAAGLAACQRERQCEKGNGKRGSPAFRPTGSVCEICDPLLASGLCHMPVSLTIRRRR